MVSFLCFYEKYSSDLFFAICCNVQNLLQSYICASSLRRNSPRFNYPLKAKEFITAKFIIAKVIKFLIAKARGRILLRQKFSVVTRIMPQNCVLFRKVALFSEMLPSTSSVKVVFDRF